MTRHRIYHPKPLVGGESVVLTAEAAHHVVRVLRLRPGARLVLFDGRGCECEAVLIEAGRKTAEVEVGHCRPRDLESPLSIHLLQGISRGERMDYTIQKCVELGVAEITPVITARTVVALSTQRRENRQAHWQRVVIGACEQCGRNRVPSLHPILPWAAVSSPGIERLKLVLDPAGERGIGSLPAPASAAVTLLVGPEGGLTGAELEAARALGFIPVRLGPRTLRTETAGIAVIGALQTLWGDLG